MRVVADKHDDNAKCLLYDEIDFFCFFNWHIISINFVQKYILFQLLFVEILEKANPKLDVFFFSCFCLNIYSYKELGSKTHIDVASSFQPSTCRFDGLRVDPAIIQIDKV
jgi:hypothetical protein